MTTRPASFVTQEPTAPRILHAVPAGQPTSVHQLAPGLLEAYEAVGGQVHLAGCALEDVPVVRFGGDPDRQVPEDIILCPEQKRYQSVESSLSALLGLGNVSDALPPAAANGEWIRQVVADAADFAGQSESDMEVVVIWCKYVRGKIQCTIGEALAEQAFEGWAHSLKPPPFHCEVTGADSLRLAVTSDSRIIAAEQMGQCSLTAKRLPNCELVRCSVTDRLVAAENVARCPVVLKPLLPDELVTCSSCREQVSPEALYGGTCLVCGSLRRARFDDDRLLRVFASIPRLAAWKYFRMGESASVYVLTASNLFKQRLVVVDKISGQLRHAAQGVRFSRVWTPLAEKEFSESL
ncbi:MAG TPA: hypothetical protein QF761_10825 [Pirellulales bacterium]|nr:hypothetical protein [Pirellulales bacterium]